MKCIRILNFVIMMCILYSCTDDMSLNNYIQEELEDVEVVDISDDKDPYLLQIIKCEEFVGNKALSVNDVVKNAGSIYIDGSEFQTVIIGDLRWIVSDLNIMTELDPKYHTLLWSAPENHRGWKNALWLYDNCDNDEINGLVTIDVDEWVGPIKKSKVKGSVTTTHYLYKHAMIIDSLLQNDEDFIECDELIDEYEPIGKWHIPSVKNAELIQGLTFVDVANVMKLKKTGHYFHEIENSADENKKITESLYLNLVGTDYSVHWYSDFVPGTGTGIGPTGTFFLSFYSLDNKKTTYAYGQQQALEPMAPIRLVQRVRKISE